MDTDGWAEVFTWLYPANHGEVLGWLRLSSLLNLQEPTTTTPVPTHTRARAQLTMPALYDAGLGKKQANQKRAIRQHLRPSRGCGMASLDLGWCR